MNYFINHVNLQSTVVLYYSIPSKCMYRHQKFELRMMQIGLTPKYFVNSQVNIENGWFTQKSWFSHLSLMSE